MIGREIAMKFKYCTTEQIEEDAEIQQYAEAIKILEGQNND